MCHPGAFDLGAGLLFPHAGMGAGGDEDGGCEDKRRRCRLRAEGVAEEEDAEKGAEPYSSLGDRDDIL